MATVVEKGPHPFHSDVIVLAVPVGTLAIRAKDWREVPGMGHGSTHVPIAEAGAWLEVYEQRAAAYEAKEGRRPGQFASLFYIVEEEGRTACGCIAAVDGALYLSG